MVKFLAVWTLVLICAVILLPISSAYVANSSTYSIDSMHTGLAGVNASTASYYLRPITSYQQSGSPNANTASYRLNLGALAEYIDMCGNGRLDYKEYCDNGAGNGACPNTCSSYCTLNTCTPEEEDDDDDDGGGSSGSSNIIWYPPSARLNSTPVQEIKYESRTFLELPKGITAMNFNSSGIPLSTITLETTEAVPNVRFVIRTVKNSTTVYSKNTVYNYLQIDHDALPDDKIYWVKIRFMVTRAWMTNNSISKNDIVLFRYVYGWESLPTRVVGEMTDYVLFEAESPGLSIFAISKKGETLQPITSSITDEVISEDTFDDAPRSAIESSQDGAADNTGNVSGTGNTGSAVGNAKTANLGKWMMIIPAVVIFVIIIAVMVIRKRKSDIAENQAAMPFVPKEPDETVLRLKEWISKQEVKGYTDRQLEQHLIGKGYPKEKIDEAILELKK